MMDRPNGKLAMAVRDKLHYNKLRWPATWELIKYKVNETIARKRNNIAGEMKREFLRKWYCSCVSQQT